ncbi:MAG: ATP-binding protein [Halobacteriovoraceae bacterium]|nr:ATP-binding protein [Halobacteriovoraceae bacterium]
MKKQKINGNMKKTTSSKKKSAKTKQIDDDQLISLLGENIGFWDWSDVDKQEQYWSKTFYSLLGYKKDELKSTSKMFFSLLHPEDKKKKQDLMNRHFQENVPFNLKCRLKKSTGEYAWFKCSGQALRDEKGNPARMAGYIEDIDDWIDTIEQLKRSNDDLDLFASISSHDLREPLRGIRNYTQFLVEDYIDKLDEEGKKYLETIKKLCIRLDNYLDSLFKYSRLSRDELQFNGIKIKDLLDEIKITIIDSSNDSIKINYSDNMPVINCDKTKMMVIFTNLIRNSIRYNKEKVKIISIKHQDIGKNFHQFSVSDNGIGIKKEHWDSIFVIFKRLHRKDQYEGGVGLGLAMIKKTVEKHNGKVWVEKSKEGEGTTICFTIKELKNKIKKAS